MIELAIVLGFLVAVFFLFDPLELCDDPIDPWLRTGVFVLLVVFAPPIAFGWWVLSKVL